MEEATIFEAALLEGLDETVRSYLGQAILPGAELTRSWLLRMKGSIKVGLRLPFEARQELDGESFTWRARVPSERIRLLEVADSYRDDDGGMIGRIAGRKVFSDTSPDAARSAATRAVMESTMVPATLLPGRGVEWRVVSGNEVAFRRPGVELAEEVTIRLDGENRAAEVEAPRWLKPKGEDGRLVPFLCRFEGTFESGGMKVPSKLVAGWITDGEFEPFFEADITSVEPISVP